MHVFIDESGQYIPLDGAKPRAAATLALIVPSSARLALGQAYRKLKKRLRSGGAEIKGSSLSESEAASVISLLRAYDVIVEAVVLDVGAHSAGDVNAFKARQADRLIAHITREHEASLIQELLVLQERLLALSNQLFLQVFAMWQLIPRLLETGTMYYSQRKPIELRSFTWRVDAKGASITHMEALWTALIAPLIATKTMLSPMAAVAGGDYSYYEGFDVPPPDGSRPRAGQFYTDLSRLLSEDFAFIPSQADSGVQLADLLASILTRALNGKLQKAGWESLGSLFVGRREQTLRLIALSLDATQPQPQDVTNPLWIAVIQQLEAHARPMLIRA